MKKTQLRQQMLDDLGELERRRSARKHLLPFVEYTYPGQWVSGRHHEEVCAALEAVERGEIRRLMISMPPRSSKSEIVSRRFPAWCMGRHSDWQMIAASHTAQLANDMSSDVMRIIREPEYQRLFDTRLDAKAQAADRWYTTAGGIYVSAGVGGSITGRGANCLIIDDPVKGRNDAESPRMREIAWRWYLGDAFQRLMTNGAIVFCMTRWHEDDLAGRILAAAAPGEWHQIVMPAISNEHTEHEEPLWPEMWPIEEMRSKRATFTNGGRIREWLAQYQQQPTVEEGDYMRRAWFDDARYKPDELPKALRIFMASDFAVTEAREGADPDFTEHGVFGICPRGDAWAIDWWHGQKTPDVWIDERLRLVKRHKPQAVFGEGGVIRRSVEPFLVRRKRETRINSRDEWLNPVKDKATRGRAFQAMASMGRVHFPAGVEWADRVVEQCVAFPMAKHDDAFDVCALLCLAIDDAHPAIVTRKERKKQDAWDELDDASVQAWRVV